MSDNGSWRTRNARRCATPSRPCPPNYGADYYLEKARAGQHTDELWTEAGKLGFIGVNLPEEYGGGGAGMYELSLVMEEMAAGGCALLMMVVSPAIDGTIIAKFGTDEQKKRWLPGIADGSITMAFAITEPDAGSNSHRITTTARRDGSDWILSGQKVYISGVDQAQAVLVVGRTAQTSPAAKRNHCGPRCSWCPPTPPASPTPRSTWRSSARRISSRYSSTTSGYRPTRWSVRRTPPSPSCSPALIRAHHGCGQCRRDGPLRDRQGHRLRQDSASVEDPDRRAPGHRTSVGAEPHRDRAGQADDAEAATLYDGGDDFGAAEAANMAKYAAGEASVRAVDQAVQSLGGNGLTKEYGIASMLTASRLARIAPVSREMILNFVAQTSLGLPRSY